MPLEDVGQPTSSGELQGGIYKLYKIRRIHTEGKMWKRNFKINENKIENAHLSLRVKKADKNC